MPIVVKMVAAVAAVGVLFFLEGCGSGGNADPTIPRQRWSPACRKQTDLVAVNVPVAENPPKMMPMLMFFGGTGYDFSINFTSKNYSKKHEHYFNDTWMFNLTSMHWHKPELTPALAPGVRWKGMSTSFNNGQNYVLFGGCNTDDAKGVMNDLWVFTPASKINGGWRRVTTKNTPPPRRGHVVTTNSTHLLVWGGKGENANHTGHICLPDFWALPLESLNDGSGEATWTRGSDFPGKARWGATGAVIKESNGREVLAVFGGRYKPKDKYIYFPELWLYDLAADSWELQPKQKSHPHSRDHHGTAVVNGELYIFGGRVKDATTADAALNDVWSYSPITHQWTELWRNGTMDDQPGNGNKAGSFPKQRFGFGVDTITWQGKEAMAIFGGETLPGGPKKSVTNDVWVFDSKTKWHELSPHQCSPHIVAPSPPPPATRRCTQWAKKEQSSCDGARIGKLNENIGLVDCQNWCAAQPECACINVPGTSLCEMAKGNQASSNSETVAAYVCEDAHLSSVALTV